MYVLWHIEQMFALKKLFVVNFVTWSLTLPVPLPCWRPRLMLLLLLLLYAFLPFLKFICVYPY